MLRGCGNGGDRSVPTATRAPRRGHRPLCGVRPRERRARGRQLEGSGHHVPPRGSPRARAWREAHVPARERRARWPATTGWLVGRRWWERRTGREARLGAPAWVHLRLAGHDTWSKVRAGRGRGKHAGRRPGQAPPSARLPSPRFSPPPPALLPSLLSPFPSPSFRAAAREGEGGGWAGGFAALRFSASEALAKQRRERAAGSAHARETAPPPRPARAETQQIRDSE